MGNICGSVKKKHKRVCATPSMNLQGIISGHLIDDQTGLPYTEYEIQQTIEQYGQMQQKHDLPPSACLKLGVCLFLQGFHEAAEEYLNKVVKEIGNSSNALFVLGEIYYGRKQFDKAFEQFQKVIAIESTIVRAYYRLSQICYKYEDYNLGIQYSETGIHYDPNYLQLYYILGSCYIELQRLDEAIGVLSVIKNHMPKAYLSLGHIYKLQKQYSAAQREYVNAYQKGKGTVRNQALLFLAITEFEVGKMTLSLQHFSKVAQSGPAAFQILEKQGYGSLFSNELLINGLGCILQEEWDRAEKWLSKAAKKFPSMTSYFFLCLILYTKGQYDQAMIYLKEICQYNKNDYGQFERVLIQKSKKMIKSITKEKKQSYNEMDEFPEEENPVNSQVRYYSSVSAGKDLNFSAELIVAEEKKPRKSHRTKKRHRKRNIQFQFEMQEESYDSEQQLQENKFKQRRSFSQTQIKSGFQSFIKVADEPQEKCYIF